MTRLSLFTLSILIIIGCSSKSALIKQEQTSSIPIYGNWCGLAHPKDINTLPEAIDDLDLICKKHDLCYEEKGMFSCECDVAMNQKVTELFSNPDLDVEQKVFAKSFNIYMSNSFCEGDAKGKTGASRILNNIYNKSREKLGNIFGKFNAGKKEASNQDLEELKGGQTVSSKSNTSVNQSNKQQPKTLDKPVSNSSSLDNSSLNTPKNQCLKSGSQYWIRSEKCISKVTKHYHDCISAKGQWNSVNGSCTIDGRAMVVVDSIPLVLNADTNVYHGYAVPLNSDK